MYNSQFIYRALEVEFARFDLDAENIKNREIREKFLRNELTHLVQDLRVCSSIFK